MSGDHTSHDHNSGHHTSHDHNSGHHTSHDHNSGHTSHDDTSTDDTSSGLYDAFGTSPVPAPGPDAVPPELFHGIYGMPAFVTIPTDDLAESVDFWVRGLGFFELFSIPGRLVHLRRWQFQDVLLVAAEGVPERPPAMSASFACVLSQVDPLVEACRTLRPHAVEGPLDTPWNTRDVAVITPENARIVFTAAKPFDPASQEARNLEAIGITPPGADRGDHGVHA